MSGDLRAVLEALAYGDDERITPSDRLKAITELRTLEPPPTITGFEQEIREWDDATVDRELDDLCAEEIVEAVRAEDGRWPRLAALLRAMVEERARELADRDAIEREIEDKVRERSRWLLERELHVTTSTTETDSEEGDQVNRPADEERKALQGRRESVPPPPGVEPDAGFRRRPRIRRLDA
jgi:hypothetical protein